MYLFFFSHHQKHESYLATAASLMSSTTSTSSDEEKFHHHHQHHHSKSGKITLNSKQVNKSNSFSSSSHRRDSLKKQQLLHQQQQQEVAAKEQQESNKQTDISSMNEPDVDIILNSSINNAPIAADTSSIVTAEAVDEAVYNAANDSETELRRRKVLEWTVQAMDVVVEQTVDNNAKLTRNRDPTEEEEEEEMKESKTAEQAILSDSILDKTDKSIVYDFMSSMQESNDDEEQLMLKTKTRSREVTGIKSMSADELDVASAHDQIEEAARPHSTTDHVDAGASSLTATGSEAEYAGAKSDNEAFIQGTILYNIL